MPRTSPVFMISSPDAVVVQPSTSANTGVIRLHGLGADGHDFEPFGPHLGSVLAERTRFVLCHASERPVIINGGYVMRAWYSDLEHDIE